MSNIRVRGVLALVSLACLGIVGSATQAQLTINPIFDTTIIADPNAATIESTIHSVVAQYAQIFSTPITVNILFKEGAGLGSSSTYFETGAYSQYLSALQAHSTSANDAIALAHLPAGPNNPVNGNSQIDVTTANLRALGFNASPPPGQPDSTITLNTPIMNIDRAHVNRQKFDLVSVAEHEIDEALGFGSALNGLTNGAPSPTGPISPEDLFRFDQNGNRTFTTSASAEAFFSIDGGHTDLARFNQTEGGDFGDWYSPGGQTPQVQDAFATPGATPNLGVELTALDVIGYTAVPELSTVGTLGLGMSGLALLLRRRS